MVTVSSIYREKMKATAWVKGKESDKFEQPENCLQCLFWISNDQLTSSLCIRVGTSLHVVGDSSQLASLVDPQPWSSFLTIFQVQTWSNCRSSIKTLMDIQLYIKWTFMFSSYNTFQSNFYKVQNTGLSWYIHWSHMLLFYKPHNG